MKRLRNIVMAVAMLTMCMVSSVAAEVSIGIGLPHVSIGINLPLFPELVRVPGYPVYYAPRLDANYFFYDSLYWVYLDDHWYSSYWYNGPWWLVEPEFVPVYILRVPVRYYRQPPEYFRGWRANAPPRWGQHWGHNWEQRRRGWDKWKRGSGPAPAPLPVYQRQYSGDKYPRLEQQRQIRNQHYRYQPRDKTVRQHVQPRVEQRTPAPTQRGRQDVPATRNPQPQDHQRSTPPRAPVDTRSQGPHRGNDGMQRVAPTPRPAQQREFQDQRLPPREAPSEQHVPRPQRQEQRSLDRRESQEPGGGHGQGQRRDDERGRDRN